MITIIARWTVEPSNVQKVMENLPHLVNGSRSEPGCVAYTPYIESSNPNSVLIFEQYQDNEAVEAHRKSEHFQKYAVGVIVPLLATRALQVLQDVSL